MKTNSFHGKLVFAGLVASILFATVTLSLNPQELSLLLPVYGSTSNDVLTLSSNPYPSKANNVVSLSGTYKTSSGNPIANWRIVLEYSTNLKSWDFIGTSLTNSYGKYALSWKPSRTGLFMIRASSNQTSINFEHVVANYIVALDGSGDFTNVQTTLSKLPVSGGTIFIKKGVYPSAGLRIFNRSNVNIVGSGYNTVLTKDWGVQWWIANVTDLTIKNIRFHHLSNNHYGSMSIKGSNNGLTIESNWFTRELTPLIKPADNIWFNPNSTTRNFIFRNNTVRDSTIDALALKRIIGGTIENNTIIDAATDTSRGVGCGITIENSSNLKISRNYIERTTDSGMGGINMFAQTHDLVISWNTLVNVEWGILIAKAWNITASYNRIIDPFANGIKASYSTNIHFEQNSIQQVKLYRYIYAVYITYSNGAFLVGNSVINFPSGIVIQNTQVVSLRLNNVDSKATRYISGRYGVSVYSSPSAKLENNTVTNSFDYGLSITSSPKIGISGNVISGSQRSGIRIASSNNATIHGNTLKNNGKYTGATSGRNGIDLADSRYISFETNKVFDDQPTKTQRYGLVEAGTSDYNVVIGNDFKYNAIKALVTIGTHTVIKENQV